MHTFDQNMGFRLEHLSFRLPNSKLEHAASLVRAFNKNETINCLKWSWVLSWINFYYWIVGCLGWHPHMDTVNIMQWPFTDSLWPRLVPPHLLTCLQEMGLWLLLKLDVVVNVSGDNLTNFHICSIKERKERRSKELLCRREVAFIKIALKAL